MAEEVITVRPVLEVFTIRSGGAAETVIETVREVVEIIEVGRVGPPGRPGVDANSNYVHDQIAAATVWNVAHPLNKKPSVMIVDSGDNVVIGDIAYVDNSHITISFTTLFSGKAYLN